METDIVLTFIAGIFIGMILLYGIADLINIWNGKF